MKNLKLLFILTLALLITDKIGAVTYVSEIVNNTKWLFETGIFRAYCRLNVLNCVSLDTNKQTRFEFKKGQPGKVTLLIEKRSRAILRKRFLCSRCKI